MKVWTGYDYDYAASQPFSIVSFDTPLDSKNFRLDSIPYVVAACKDMRQQLHYRSPSTSCLNACLALMLSIHVQYGLLEQFGKLH